MPSIHYPLCQNALFTFTNEGTFIPGSYPVTLLLKTLSSSSEKMRFTRLHEAMGGQASSLSGKYTLTLRTMAND